MNKESNAIRRLGSQTNYKSGSKTMYSMPEEAGGNESISPEREGEDQGFLLHNTTIIATFASVFFATFVISIIVSRMWDEDEIKLNVLHMLVRVLQAIARLCGGWALEFEQIYNDHVNALH